MYIYIYIYLYIYLCVYIYVYIYTNFHIYIRGELSNSFAHVVMPRACILVGRAVAHKV